MVRVDVRWDLAQEALIPVTRILLETAEGLPSAETVANLNAFLREKLPTEAEEGGLLCLGLYAQLFDLTARWSRPAEEKRAAFEGLCGELFAGIPFPAPALFEEARALLAHWRERFAEHVADADALTALAETAKETSPILGYLLLRASLDGLMCTDAFLLRLELCLRLVDALEATDAGVLERALRVGNLDFLYKSWEAAL